MKNNFVVRKAAELLGKIRRAYTKGCEAARNRSPFTANRPSYSKAVFVNHFVHAKRVFRGGKAALRTAKLFSLIIPHFFFFP